MSEALTHGSLFTGMGGLDLAIAEVFGAETAWVSDVDPGANLILAHRYPHAPNLGDITAVDWASVEPVDIISGGSPCQDLSHAGKRAGMTDGTRSNLWVAMREAIAVLRPRLVVWENVRGAYSASADSGLEHCPGCMGSPGDGGPALRRFRVFVVAADANRATGDQWRLSADGAAQGGRAWSDAGGPDRAPLSLLPTPSAGAFNDAEDLDQWEARRQRVAQTAHNGNGFGTPLGVAVRLLPTVKATNNENRPSPGFDNGGEMFYHILRENRWGVYAEAIARQERTFGRPAPEPTEPGAKGNPRLSAAFTEWMMGLPAGWITDVPSITRNEALKACGNGVVPQQAAAALRYALPLLLGGAS